MTKKVSLASALLCCFIWGTTFIAQDTGMDNIGPYTFNGCLLYTSPSPRDKRQSRMPSSA